MKPLRAVLFAFILVCSVVRSQCDPGGAVALRVNGTLPSGSDAASHVVALQAFSPLTLTLTESAPPRPFLLLAGAAIACPGTATAWGGSIDLVGAVVLLNGLAPTSPLDFLGSTNFITTAPIDQAAYCADLLGPAFQAVTFEAANPPFLLDNTVVAQPWFRRRTSTVYGALGDDSFVTHALCVPIVFGGTVRTQLHVGSNGMVTFNSGAIDMTPTPTELFAGFQSGPTISTRPGIAVLWGDFARASVLGDDVTVLEDATNGVVEVQWNNQVWWNSMTPAGSWSVELGVLGAGSFLIDLASATPGIGNGANADVDPVTGVTDGSSFGPGLDLLVDLSTIISGGGYIASPGSPPVSICESFPLAGSSPATPLDLTLVHGVDMGTYRWHIY